MPGVIFVNLHLSVRPLTWLLTLLADEYLSIQRAISHLYSQMESLCRSNRQDSSADLREHRCMVDLGRKYCHRGTFKRFAVRADFHMADSHEVQYALARADNCPSWR